MFSMGEYICSERLKIMPNPFSRASQIRNPQPQVNLRLRHKLIPEVLPFVINVQETKAGYLSPIVIFILGQSDLMAY
jgi:hypothetical protein